MREAQPPARASLTCSEQTDGEGTRRGGDAEPIADCTVKAAADADKRSRCASVRNLGNMESMEFQLRARELERHR